MLNNRILITGGAGFLGHHFVESFLKTTDIEIVILDRIDGSTTLNRLRDVVTDRRRVKWHWHDLKAPLSSQLIHQIGKVDTIIHLAAASHVDRSIEDPLSFVMDNVVGTCNLLNYARQVDGLERVLYFSTDEVFGPAPEGVLYKEWDRYRSANPYAASKSGAEELAVAFENTYKLPIIITHTMNCYGERQHIEKYIPSTIKKVRDGDRVIIHANKTCTKAGSRFYIHARNVADAVTFVLANGQVGEKYNIVGEKEVDNLALAKLIANIVGKPLIYEMSDFHSERPGHDLRYGLSGERLAAMGWKPPVSFEQSLTKTVRWMLDNPEWLEG
jgi:dTDP-glucose 4,6-dehydratase